MNGKSKDSLKLFLTVNLILNISDLKPLSRTILNITATLQLYPVADIFLIELCLYQDRSDSSWAVVQVELHHPLSYFSSSVEPWAKDYDSPFSQNCVHKLTTMKPHYKILLAADCAQTIFLIHCKNKPRSTQTDREFWKNTLCSTVVENEPPFSEIMWTETKFWFVPNHTTTQSALKN